VATARRFAAALGIIAFVFVAGFSAWQGNELDTSLVRALVALVMFAALGFVVGLIGSALVSDSADGEVARKAVAERLMKKKQQEERAAREKREAESRARAAEATPPAPAGKR